MRHVVVAGGGISGLAGALRLVSAGVRVTLLEGTGRLGGKLHTRPDGSEAGAENFLMRDPAGGASAAVRLVHELGLSTDLVHPTGLPAATWNGERLEPLPTGTLFGIPAADTAGLDRDLGKPVLGPGEDVAVGVLVRARCGDAVVDRLVDPLLGGVYAGRSDQLSLAMAMPGLHRLLQQEHTLTGAVRRILAAAPPSAAPIFGTVAGGLTRLVTAAAQRLGEHGGAVRLGHSVRGLRRTASGLEIDCDGARIAADGLLLAVPAGKAARILQRPFDLEYASVALVTLGLPRCELPELSGLLVPAGSGLTIKAATFFSRKWAHLAAGDATVIRASIGRAGEVEALRGTDAELIATARRDLQRVLGSLPDPGQATVQRWGGGLPQYAPGHRDRVGALRESLVEEKVALAGAGYDGIGIPACIRSGEQAADLLLQRFRG